MRTALRALDGLRATGEPLPPVRLVREYKGPTLGDLTRQEFVARLPGQVRSALAHIDNGDLVAAERALPGRIATVHAGPGHRRRSRRGLWIAAGIALLVAIAALLSEWLGA